MVRGFSEEDKLQIKEKLKRACGRAGRQMATNERAFHT